MPSSVPQAKNNQPFWNQWTTLLLSFMQVLPQKWQNKNHRKEGWPTAFLHFKSTCVQKTELMWGFQPSGKTNEGCTRVNSSCPDRDAQGLFLRELWTPPHLWEAQKSGPQRAAVEPWKHSNLWYTTLPWAPAVRRSRMQLNRRWHSQSRSPSAAILTPFARSSLKSNKSITSASHISRSNKYQRQKLSYAITISWSPTLPGLEVQSKFLSTKSWGEGMEQTVSPSHWRQWRCTRLTWPQTLASFSVALRRTQYQIPPKALIKAVFPGSSQTLSKFTFSISNREGNAAVLASVHVCSSLEKEKWPHSLFSAQRAEENSSTQLTTVASHLPLGFYTVLGKSPARLSQNNF